MGKKIDLRWLVIGVVGGEGHRAEGEFKKAKDSETWEFPGWQAHTLLGQQQGNALQASLHLRGASICIFALTAADDRTQAWCEARMRKVIHTVPGTLCDPSRGIENERQAGSCGLECREEKETKDIYWSDLN